MYKLRTHYLSLPASLRVVKCYHVNAVLTNFSVFKGDNIVGHLFSAITLCRNGSFISLCVFMLLYKSLFVIWLQLCYLSVTISTARSPARSLSCLVHYTVSGIYYPWVIHLKLWAFRSEILGRGQVFDPWDNPQSSTQCSVLYYNFSLFQGLPAHCCQ